MSLEDCGTSNSRDMHKALVGEKIVALFPDDEGRFWIVCESGYAIVFGSLGVNAGGPVYWRESPAKVAAVIAKRYTPVAPLQRELAEAKARYSETLDALVAMQRTQTAALKRGVELLAERDEAKATAARWKSDCRTKERAYSATYGEWTTSKRRVTELEGALRTLRDSARALDEALEKVPLSLAAGEAQLRLQRSLVPANAALTPSAAKPEGSPRFYCPTCKTPMMFRPGETRIHCPLCDAAKGDGAKCGRCGAALVNGRCPNATPVTSDDDCAAPAAGEQRWGILNVEEDYWAGWGGGSRRTFADEAAAAKVAAAWNRRDHTDDWEARPLPPAAKGEK